MADRPYAFAELTNSLCSLCLRKVEAKVVFEDGAVYLLKHCPEHGAEKALISSDVEYYRWTRRLVSAGQLPLRFNTEVESGCPFDCGLCEGHEQHSCVALIEITDCCDLHCPVCYANSSPHRQEHRSLEEIKGMLEAIVANEGEPPVIQISGGEPTLHPDFFAVMDLARASPAKHLMLNTNGIRIGSDPAFAERLAGYSPRFEIYLQFDSLQEEALLRLRGRDLREIHERTLDRLNALGLSTTLVVTLQKGVNDGEIGDLLDFALKQPAVRGVTFQPIQVAGRLTAFDPATDRLTLSCVRQRILDQHDLFVPEDIVPVPCHADGVAMAYALKMGSQTIPLTRHIDQNALLENQVSTIAYEGEEVLREQIRAALSAGHSPESSASALDDLLCCLPGLEAPGEINYTNVFRVIIMQFLDPFIFDVRSVKRSCVHIVHPDGRVIPFDTYNLLYRDGRISGLRGRRRNGPSHV